MLCPMHYWEHTYTKNVTEHSIFLFAKTDNPVLGARPNLHYYKRKTLDMNVEFQILKLLLHQVMGQAPSSHSPFPFVTVPLLYA